MTDSDVAEAAGGEALPQDQTNQEQPQETEVESRARHMGWAPQEKFRGDPARWLPAEDFVARSDAAMPMLIERNRTLDDKLGRMERELAESNRRLGEVSQVLVEFRDFSSKAEERAYQKARRELQARGEEAVLNADIQTHRAVVQQMEELEKSVVRQPVQVTPPQQQQPQQQPPHPDTVRWVQDNPWFNTDQFLNRQAHIHHEDLLREKPGMSIGDNLAEVKRQLMRRFPEKFGINPARDAPSAVGGPASAPIAGPARAPKKKGFDDLPQEAKDSYRNWARKFAEAQPDKPYTKEQFLAQYGDF